MFKPLPQHIRLGASLALALAVTLPCSTQAIESGLSAPDFELASQSSAVKLAALKGKVVYLDFWASWCAPCRQSFPWMNDMQARFADQGLQVLAVNLDNNNEDAQKFLAQTAANFTIAYDPKGLTPRLYGVKGMPTSILIGRDGKVLLTHMGFNQGNRAELEQKIRSALGDKK